MTSEITLFVNPTAGRGRGAHAAQPAASALRAAGFAVRTVLGEDAADALARARAAVDEGTGALVAVGGDGMANLALQAVAGTRTPFGLVAVGTGNDFARTLGLPVRDPAAAGRLIADALKEGRVHDTDLGGVGDHWFGTVLASGFDSRVNDRGNRMRWPTGRLKYDLAMLAELAAFRPLVPDHARRRPGPRGRGDLGGRRQRIVVRRWHADLPGRGPHRRALRHHRGRGLQPYDPAAGVPERVPGHPCRPPQGDRAAGRAGPLPLSARCVRGAVSVVGP